jgi:hypothetical protein
MAKSYPTAYSLFKKPLNLRRHNENKKQLIRFVYRYRLANSFSGIVAENIGNSLKGYNSILKVFLSYTAYEQLLNSANGLHVFGLLSVDKNFILNKPLAEKLRNNKELINFLFDHSVGSILISQLSKFRESKNDDVVCIAYAIRNVFSHGELTATAIGTRLASQRKVLDELADCILAYCDDNFTKCVEKLR